MAPKPKLKPIAKNHISTYKGKEGKVEDQELGSEILNVIKLGYRLPFWDVPPAYCSKNNLSAFKNFEFAENSIAELLENKKKWSTDF